MKSEIISTFVIPVYNTQAGLLDRCINSIVDNCSKKVELIIVNDGSTNQETINKCNEMEKQGGNIRVYHQKNQGVSVARNYGINASKGKYIIFVDPDDYLTEDIQDAVENLEYETADVVVFDCYRETADGKRTKIELGDTSDTLNTSELINNTLFCGVEYSEYYGGAVWAKAFRREFLKDKKLLFDVNLRKAQDRVFMLYAYDSANTVKYIRIASYVYYQNFESICNKYNSNTKKRSHAFVDAVYHFLKITKSNIDKNKLLSMVRYLSFFEVLYLDLFNYENPNNRSSNILSAKAEYDAFHIKEAMSNISINQFESLSGKIKYILIRLRLFGILRHMVIKRQSKNRKN